ncbi:MAG: hypothetical protein J0H01_30750 [Rhizobiales bacterium]|nr:hypothetical protein [Hyphomicrobiales bacterium]
MDTIILGVCLITASLIGLFAYVDREAGMNDGGADLEPRPQASRDRLPGSRPGPRPGQHQ